MVTGEIGIFDMIDMKPHHYAKMFTPSFLKVLKLCILNLPFITKNILIINCHPLLEKGFAAIKTVLPKKLADRVRLFCLV